MPPGILALVIPTYVFATPVLGGQLSVGAIAAYGRVSTSLAGTLTGALTVPGFGSIPFGPRSDSISDSVWGFGDVIPMASLRWNNGVHNYMTYITGDIPVGAYNSSPPVEYRHRPRRDRRRRRLHLFQSADRARILGGARLHLQFRRINRRNTRTASTCISIGARRSS